MRSLSLVICVAVSMECLGVATAAFGQSAKSLKEAIDANPQVAAIARATPKIVGGEPVDIADRPWQVALVRGLDPEPKRSQFCGGSVIDPGWVLTAAHCVRNTLVREDPSRVNVVVGTSQFFLGGERIPVAAIHIHPKYVDQTHDFDFALLRLTRSVTMGGGAVTKPVDLADANAQIPDGTKAFVSGWGAVSEGGPGSLDLLGVEIPIVSNDVCNKPESYGGDVTTNMLCAGRASGGADSCQGDSGGPLTAKLQERTALIGVVSFGEGCARRLKFGVYARVPVAASWITTTMKK